MELRSKKAVQLLNYFAQKEGGKINRMKAVKLIWLADRLHLRLYGRTISKMDDYVAMKNGPLSSSILNMCNFPVNPYISEYIAPTGRYEYEALKETDIDVFSKTDVSILETIHHAFGHMGRFVLSEMSHDYPEWKRFEIDLKKISTSFHVTIEDFFEDPAVNVPVFAQSEEELTASMDLYSDYKALSRA